MSDVKRRLRGLEKDLASGPSVGYCQHTPMVLLTNWGDEEPPETPILCEECGLPIENVTIAHMRVVTVGDVRGQSDLVYDAM